MSPSNPYVAPRADRAPSDAFAVDRFAYVPLGWRTTLAGVSLVGIAISSVALHTLTAAFGPPAPDSSRLAISLLTALAGLSVLVTQLGAIVFVLVWIHRASTNLRGLGRTGMRETPLACVVSFVIPIVSLWMPLGAMTEIWRASDPSAAPGGWGASKATPLLGVWWASWLAACFMGAGVLFVKSATSSGAAFELASDVPNGMAAVALVLVLRGIDARQSALRGRIAAERYESSSAV